MAAAEAAAPIEDGPAFGASLEALKSPVSGHRAFANIAARIQVLTHRFAIGLLAAADGRGGTAAARRALDELGLLRRAMFEGDERLGLTPDFARRRTERLGAAIPALRRPLDLWTAAAEDLIARGESGGAPPAPRSPGASG